MSCIQVRFSWLLHELTKKVMSGLVMVRYRRRPTRRRYGDGSLSSSLSEGVSRWFYSIGILVSLDPIIPASLSISRVYLRWEMTIPCLE